MIVGSFALLLYECTWLCPAAGYTSMCLSTCVMEVGCSWGGTRLVMRNLRTIEPQTLRRTLGIGWKLLEQLMDAISVSGSQTDAIWELQVKPEQQLKRTQSRSNSRSGHNRGAVETDSS